jgi:hypothetical protein
MVLLLFIIVMLLSIGLFTFYHIVVPSDCAFRKTETLRNLWMLPDMLYLGSLYTVYIN